MVLELYRRHPTSIRRMVLADGYAGWRGSLGAEEAEARLAGVRAALAAMARADLTDVLPTIRVPTQLVWGELDVRSPLAVARELERRIPGATLAVILDFGHVSKLEAPHTFNEVVREFLGRPD